MTWIKLRNTFADDDRWIDAGANAFTVHVAALCYSDLHLTDGAISAARARRVTPAVHPAEVMEAVDRLVELGFWTATEDGGYQIVDYLADQIAKEDTLRTRARWAEDKRWRRQHKVGDHAICPPEKCPVASRESAETTSSAGTASHAGKGNVPRGQRNSPTRKWAVSGSLDPTRPDPTQREGREGKGERGGSASGEPARSARRAPSAPPPEATPSTDRQASKGSRATKTKPITDASADPSGPGATPAPPPKGESPRCRHGVVRGDLGGPWGRFVCAECEAMAPKPGTPEFDAWAEPVRGFLVSNDVACADPDNEKYAKRLAKAKFHAHTKTQPYTVVASRYVPLWRTVKAYAVEQVEPGRLSELMAANGPNRSDR